MSDSREPPEDSAAPPLRESDSSPVERLAREIAASPTTVNLARELPESPTAKLVREMAASPTAKLARELAGSPTAKLVREIAASPTAKLARELAESPTAKLAREMAASPTAKLARELAESPTAKLAREMATSPMAKLAGELAAKMACEVALSGTGAMATAQMLAALKPIEGAPGFAEAISRAHKALADFGKPYGGLAEAVRTIEEQSRSFQTSLVASLGGTIGDVARMNQWARALGSIASPDITNLYPNLPTLASEVSRLHESAIEALTGPIALDQDRLGSMLGLRHRLSANIEVTRLKMSAFAGITDLLGAQARAHDDAYHSLFGEWRTRPDLPEAYWRDSRVRRRMYDAAEVDPGLAGLDLGAAVEVIVESGLTSGVRSEANAVAVISFGDVSMTIRSHGTRGDAFKVLERFEEELRSYISRKLSEKFGPDWFKERAGAVGGDAKRVRKQALERGESPMPLIHYTELGHLSQIILGSKNWEEVFREVFINSAEFDHDMQKLIAARRPTMHIRPIDGLRLVELICVVRRLSSQMENDGAWMIAAESEQ